MKYYLVAGERSGDLHAANLMAELSKLDDNAEFRGMGGDFMIREGLVPAAHYEEVAVMGFLEVVLGFRKVLRYLSLIKKDMTDFQPDAVILVDYAGFNIKMAAFARRKGFPVHYYIAPKVWAWNQNRAYTLKKYVRRLYAILPFEPEFFRGYGMDVPYVGNPLRDELEKFIPDPDFLIKSGLGGKPVVALLPGSRQQEVRSMLEQMVGLVRQFPQWDFVVAGVDNLPESAYLPAEGLGIKVVFGKTYDLLLGARAAVVTSGTATLETALLGVPQVVVYRTSSITYALAKRLVKVPYISLVNLIAGREVVKELIQDGYNRDNLAWILEGIVAEGDTRKGILEGYQAIQDKLGAKKASQETARLIYGDFSQEG